jgi:two-component system, OmpR family, sensor kinase
MTTPDLATAGTQGARPRRSGVSVRVRIATSVALLVALTLAGAGLLVYVIEYDRLDDNTIAEVDQEFGEFERLARGEDPATSDPWAGVRPLLETFLERNVPDDDERLVTWVGDAPYKFSPGARSLGEDQQFLDAARPLAAEGGSTRLDTPSGELLISAQTITIGDEPGALLVLNYLDDDRSELLDTMRTYAIVAVLSLSLIVAMAFWQAGRLLAPLRVVRQTADEITATDLSRRLPERGNDDVTALTRTFNGMLDRLDAAFTGQRQLLDDAGHELRTPLTILQGHLELLDVDDAEEVAETRQLLLEEIDRMARLVDDLILLAKTERPGFLDPAPTDVADLTETVAAKASGLGDRAWTVDETAELTVPLDGQRITQALLQLAHNAVKHTGPGDLVAIGSVAEPEAVLFWVRDTGPGVAPHDRERIFERFGRAAGAEDRNPEGFGLGLSIVTAIARAHGGTAWLDEEYAEGARFVLSVPVPADAVAPGSAETGEADPPTRPIPDPVPAAVIEEN